MHKIIHHIKKIRQQPEHIRRSILHVAIVILAVILFFLWIYSLGTGMGSDDAKAKAIQEVKPFSVLKDNITEQFNNISNPNSNTDTGTVVGQ